MPSGYGNFWMCPGNENGHEFDPNDPLNESGWYSCIHCNYEFSIDNKPAAPLF